jgi:hypothetical protein
METKKVKNCMDWMGIEAWFGTWEGKRPDGEHVWSDEDGTCLLEKEAIPAELFEALQMDGDIEWTENGTTFYVASP